MAAQPVAAGFIQAFIRNRESTAQIHANRQIILVMAGATHGRLIAAFFITVLRRVLTEGRGASGRS